MLMNKIQKAASFSISKAIAEYGNDASSPQWPGITVVRDHARDLFIKAITFLMSSANRTMAGHVCTCSVQIQMLIDVYDQQVFNNKHVFSEYGIHDNNCSELLWSIVARLFRDKSKQESPGMNMGKECLGMAHQAATTLRKNGIQVEPANTMIARKLELILFPNHPGTLVTRRFKARQEELMLARLARAKKDATPEAKQQSNMRRLRRKRGDASSEGIEKGGGYDFDHQNLPSLVHDLTQEMNNEKQSEEQNKKKKVKKKKQKKQKKKKKCTYCLAVDYHDEKTCPLKRTDKERK